MLISSCSSPKKTTRIVNQEYINLSFNPKLITKLIGNNTELTIIPIDAKDLDEVTDQAADRDGNYHKEFISFVESWKSKINSIPKSEKSVLQGKINTFDYLLKLEKEGVISNEISRFFKRKVINSKSGYDGSEIESLSEKRITSSEYNPYKIDEKYFSVFKLTFENKGNEIDKISLKDFQLISNEEQLYPLATEYFEKNLLDNTESIKNSLRMNMPNELIITPSQKITKFIAVPAINNENSKIQVQHIIEKKVNNFDFDILKSEVKKLYNLEKYKIIYAGEVYSNSYYLYYVIEYTDNVVYSIIEDIIYVSDEKKNIPANIYGIGFNPLTSNVYFGSLKNYKFSENKNNVVKLEFKKQKKNKKTGVY